MHQAPRKVKVVTSILSVLIALMTQWSLDKDLKQAKLEQVITLFSETNQRSQTSHESLHDLAQVIPTNWTKKLVGVSKERSQSQSWNQLLKQAISTKTIMTQQSHLNQLSLKADNPKVLTREDHSQEPKVQMLISPHVVKFLKPSTRSFWPTSTRKMQLKNECLQWKRMISILRQGISNHLQSDQVTSEE